VIVAEADVARDEPPPHGAIGMSTAYRLSDKVPTGRWSSAAACCTGRGDRRAPDRPRRGLLRDLGRRRGDLGGQDHADGAGMAAYFYSGDEVGIRQLGSEPLNLIITYPGRDAAR
jgi:hypothetical protein